jgi:N-acetylglucosamine malate deacetylase 1
VPEDRQLRVLAVMAHPDDAEILAGGTLLHLARAGCAVGIATMTSGDCGSATLSREEISRIRLGEARAAASRLGGWYECAGLRDIEVFANADTVRRTVEIMRRFRPDVVITHSPADYMLDHEETSRIARSSAFAVAVPLYETGIPDGSPRTGATPALYYADPVEGTDPMGQAVRPAFCVDIGEVLEGKVELLSCHASQREWLRAHHGMDEYTESMKTWAARRGAGCGCAFAEGFRQHLGHGYPSVPVLQNRLDRWIRDLARGTSG